jgi:hypothetical protein
MTIIWATKVSSLCGVVFKITGGTRGAMAKGLGKYESSPYKESDVHRAGFIGSANSKKGTERSSIFPHAIYFSQWTK